MPGSPTTAPSGRELKCPAKLRQLARATDEFGQAAGRAPGSRSGTDWPASSSTSSDALSPFPASDRGTSLRRSPGTAPTLQARASRSRLVELLHPAGEVGRLAHCRVIHCGDRCRSRAPPPRESLAHADADPDAFLAAPRPRHSP